MLLRFRWWRIQMNKEEIKKQIEDKFQECREQGALFSKALFELRNINFPVDEENEEEVKMAVDLGKEIDVRTAFLLRSLLIQHGNVLFI